MKLEQLCFLFDDCKKKLSDQEIGAELFYFHNDDWYSYESLIVSDSTIKTHLNKARAEQVSHHAPTSRTAWFHFKQFEAVFSLTFKVSPRLHTRQQFRLKLGEMLENASNAFKVTHNQLTGLLSKDKFLDVLKGSLTKVPGMASANASTVLESQRQLMLAVLAFDLDHFKQVNDTFGHLYGDQVLKAFAMRLERAAIAIERDVPNVKVMLGHPSGEEFLAFVVGPLNQDDLTFVGERFRRQVADEPLPTDEEWSVLAKQSDLSKVTKPSISQRTVTSSVGIATYTQPTLSETLQASAVGLLDRADTALYRSKASGRNRITFFHAILQSHGKVLEHDPETGVVVLDIGAKVGVLQGQEFRVYPPSFTGQTPVTTDDGRTKRILGFYPKIEAAQIVVFESQPEISFARCSREKVKGQNIRTGSHLEAVPLGSFAHLLDEQSVGGKPAFGGEVGDIPGPTALQLHVDRLVTSKNSPYAAIFSFRKQQEFLQKYGSASLNRALADLYTDLGSLFGTNAMRGALDGMAVCVIGVGKDFDLPGIARLISTKYSGSNDLEVECGYYLSTTIDVPDEGLYTSFSDAEAITFARYALGDVENMLDNVRRFTSSTAESLLQRLVDSHAYSQAIADGLRLKKFGVTTVKLENWIGIAYWRDNQVEEAADYFELAAAKAPANLIICGNFAQATNKLNQVQRGLPRLNAISDENLVRFKQRTPQGFYAYLILLAKAWRDKSPLFQEARFVQMRSDSVNQTDFLKLSEAQLVIDVSI